MDSDDILLILILVGYIVMWLLYLAGYGGEYRDSFMLGNTLVTALVVYRRFFD